MERHRRTIDGPPRWQTGFGINKTKQQKDTWYQSAVSDLAKEREFMRQRQAEGTCAARKREVRFGRRPIKRPVDFDSLREQYLAGEVSSRVIMVRIGISRSCFLKWVQTETN